MVQINFARKEINCKIVYYGPGMSGKTTNLEMVHRKTPEGHKGELTCIATEGDRTLFFDFMPLHLGNIMGMNIKFQLYTVPGQVYYNSTRKLVLRGADGVIFVADSSLDKMAENIESLKNLQENLAEYGKDVKEVPLVIQFNKRDIPNAVPIGTLNEKLNWLGVPTFEAVARTGEGVFATLKALSGLVIESINQREERTFAGSTAPEAESAASAGSNQGAIATAPMTAAAASASAAETSAPLASRSLPSSPSPASASSAAGISRRATSTPPPGSNGDSPSPASGQDRTPVVPPARFERKAVPQPAAPPPTANRRAAAGAAAKNSSNAAGQPQAKAAAKATSSAERAHAKSGRRASDSEESSGERNPLQTWLLVAFFMLFAVTLYFVFR